MYEENSSRIEVISKGRIQDLKVNQSNIARTKLKYLEMKVLLIQLTTQIA